ncbi:MAG: zinc ribbon domain-containing protein [Bacteroidales bacterium]|nr:zinc ribbon domain-containing protein [Bacteroidales bacterium]
MKCPHCGGEHPDTANFCPKTGKKISSSFQTCQNPACRAENIPASFTFCPHCGAALSPVEEESKVNTEFEDVNLSLALGAGGTDVENPQQNFIMAVSDVFNITGRGVVVTGCIDGGTVKVGDKLELLGGGKEHRVKVEGIEYFGKLKNEARKGESVGILLKGVDFNEVMRGAVLARRGFLMNSEGFEAQVYMFSTAEGGRTQPTGQNYSPWIYVRNMEVLGQIVFQNAAWHGLAPGENASVTVQVQFPVVVREGTRFAIRENGRTVGAGIVTKVL